MMRHVDLSSVKSSCIPLNAISLGILKMSVILIYCKLTYLKLPPYLPEDNKLRNLAMALSEHISKFHLV